uniref:Uncharacterized protein n=1 Tax=Romanomermis culicivorax TaxID=13658 RepID=A0A915KP07_ROMCU
AALYSLSQKINQKWRLDEERNQLFNRRFTTNDENFSTTIALDDVYLKENDKLKSSNRGIDNMIGSGLAILGW